MKTSLMMGACALFAGSAMGGMSVSTYEDLSEGFYGDSLHYNGVTYHEVNNVDGVFPDGSVFSGDNTQGNSLGGTVIVENAGLLYDDFPAFGSATNALTFGTTFVPGDNLSLGVISTVTMDLDERADFASLEMAYFENGPWGGMVYHLDAYLNGDLVGSDSFTIAGSDPNGRDNLAFSSLSVSGFEFDSLNLYATLGSEFTAPRILLDNLTLNTVPSPGPAALFFGAAALGGRRRR